MMFKNIITVCIMFSIGCIGSAQAMQLLVNIADLLGTDSYKRLTDNDYSHIKIKLSGIDIPYKYTDHVHFEFAPATKNSQKKPLISKKSTLFHFLENQQTIQEQI